VLGSRPIVPHPPLGENGMKQVQLPFHAFAKSNKSSEESGLAATCFT
jgi:hypothetical protein